MHWQAIPYIYDPLGKNIFMRCPPISPNPISPNPNSPNPYMLGLGIWLGLGLGSGLGLGIGLGMGLGIGLGSGLENDRCEHR